MVAIGRALMSNPQLLLCDEISLGLAPIVIRDIYARLPAIVAEGISLVIVEQDIVQALKVASHVYCLQEGRVALAGEAKHDDARENRRRVFRGVSMMDRKPLNRHGRACPGHPRLTGSKDVDARDMRGHDDGEGGA